MFNVHNVLRLKVCAWALRVSGSMPAQDHLPLSLRERHLAVSFKLSADTAVLRTSKDASTPTDSDGTSPALARAARPLRLQMCGSNLKSLELIEELAGVEGHFHGVTVLRRTGSHWQPECAHQVGSKASPGGNRLTSG
jgi:hypothetical protein